MTKQRLLAILDRLEACPEALVWVSRHPSDDAETIYNGCENLPWLIWLYEELGILDKNSKRWQRFCHASNALYTFYSRRVALGGVPGGRLWDDLYAKFLPQLKLPWYVVLTALQEMSYD